MSNYFVIRNSDGDTTVTEHSAEDLKEKLNEEYWGPVEFMDELPSNKDTNYWGDCILIIKGEVVVPQPVETVTEYKI